MILLKLLPWLFLGLLFILAFYALYKQYNRTPPQVGSKEYKEMNNNEDDEQLFN